MYNQITCILNRYKANELFCVSYRVLGRGVFGYKVIGVGKQNTEYFYNDLAKFNVVTNNEQVQSLKTVYMAGINTFDEYYLKSFAYNYIFYAYRVYYYSVLIMALYVNMLYGIILGKETLKNMSMFNFFMKRKKISKIYKKTPLFYNRYSKKIKIFENPSHVNRTIMKLRYETIYIRGIRYKYYPKDIMFKKIRALRYRRKRRKMRRIRFAYLLKGYTRMRRNRRRPFEIYMRPMLMNALLDDVSRQDMFKIYRSFFELRKRYRQNFALLVAKQYTQGSVKKEYFNTIRPKIFERLM